MLNLIDKYRLIIGIVLVVVILVSGGILVGLNIRGDKGQGSRVTDEEKIASTTTFLPSTTSSTTAVTLNSKPVSQTKASVGGVVNINTATLAQLDTLSGIGPVKAQAIIDYRAANGPFKTVDGLDKVKGIGKATIDKFRDKVTTE